MSSDPKMVTCPADNCDYSGLKSSVVAHYSGKRDGLHPGGYQKAKSLLEDSQEPEPEPKPEPQPKAHTEPNRETESSDSATDPTMGSAKPPEPEPNSDSKPSNEVSHAADDPVCPSCGGELWDFRQFEAGQYHKLNGQSVFVQGDYQCDACGQWWADE